MDDFADFDKLLGKWAYESSDNFDNYMKHVGQLVLLFVFQQICIST